MTASSSNNGAAIVDEHTREQVSDLRSACLAVAMLADREAGNSAPMTDYAMRRCALTGMQSRRERLGDNRPATAEPTASAECATIPVGYGGLEVQSLSYRLDARTVLLSDICFTAQPGTLTAVIGTSGAGKTTLARLLSGAMAPTSGTAALAGHDIYREYASLRSRIAIVPQDDVVHGRLTVQQGLNYAAELRLPADTTNDERLAAVAGVLEELELTSFADHRVDTLSGGERKRVSIALELLTKPWLLILDEPNSGLDPSLDRHLMTLLRRLADGGLVVVVMTHSLTYLDRCDQVLLLTPGGKAAFCGPPTQIGAALGTTDWADIYAYVAADPDYAHRKYLARHHATPGPVRQTSGAKPLRRPKTSLLKQISIVVRRQLRLIVADGGYLVFLALLPVVLGALSLLVRGNVGFGAADPQGRTPDEPTEILILLNVSAIFMGVALSVRDLVGERRIFLRDQAAGLSSSAYLIAKIVVYGLAVAIQTAVLTTIVVAGKGGPVHGAVLLGAAPLELYTTLAATGIVAAILGLAISSVAKSTEQILPLLVVAIMLQLVFSGGLISITGRPGLAQLSWLAPSRWGFAAAASTIDLRTVAPLAPTDEALWIHSPSWWLLDMAMLAVLGIAAAGYVRWRLRLRRRCPKSRPAHDRRPVTPQKSEERSRLYPSSDSDALAKVYARSAPSRNDPLQECH